MNLSRWLKKLLNNPTYRQFIGLTILLLGFTWFRGFPYFMAWLLPNAIFRMAALGIGSMWLVGFGFLFCMGIGCLLESVFLEEVLS